MGRLPTILHNNPTPTTMSDSQQIEFAAYIIERIKQAGVKQVSRVFMGEGPSRRCRRLRPFQQENEMGATPTFQARRGSHNHRSLVFPATTTSSSSTTLSATPCSSGSATPTS